MRTDAERSGVDTLDNVTLAKLDRLVRLSGWFPLAIVATVSALYSPVPETIRYLPLVASVVLLGLPHGALDYVALPRARAGQVDTRGLAVVGVLYAVLGSAYLALWWIAPLPAAALFIGLTWFHWGQGELFVVRDLYGAWYLDRSQQVLTTVVRGGLPMVVPLIGFPDRYRTVLETFVTPFGGQVKSWWVFSPTGRLAVAVVFGAITIATLARARRQAGDSCAWRRDATETAILWAFFLVVDPILAIGVYFCLWHSLRHLVRVGLLDGRVRDGIETGRWLAASGRVALEATPPTVGAIALVGGLFGLVPVSGSIGGAVGLYLVGIAVLTLPHTVIVTWIDREQGLWL
ncbi:MAG: Brp/Blh family beta-carotene 15,15'-dioxygenase [Halorhabdus sp.]